jgi:hypothetical protein
MQPESVRDVEKLRESLGELPEPVANPVLILVSGLPGTGKSFLSRRLQEQLPSVIVESDALRRVLFPVPSYTASEHNRVFRACHLLVEGLLKKGIRVILDATNLVERHREHLYHIADRLRVKLIIVRVEAPQDTVRQRLQGRIEGLDAEDKSDADWRVYQKMRPRVQRIGRNHFVVDTSRDIGPVIEKIVREARRPWSGSMRW